MILLYKKYDGESMIDIERDVNEALCDTYNPFLCDIPKDEYGFFKGTFTVTIEWEE